MTATKQRFHHSAVINDRAKNDAGFSQLSCTTLNYYFPLKPCLQGAVINDRAKNDAGFSQLSCTTLNYYFPLKPCLQGAVINDRA